MKNFSFSMPTIKPVVIDTSAFANVGATVRAGATAGEKVTCDGNLSVYKIRTVCGAQLPAEDRVAATELVRKMNRNGWLTADDKRWCEENHISWS